MLDFDIYFAITCFALFEIHALSLRSAEPTYSSMLVTSGYLTELNSAKSTQTSQDQVLLKTEEKSEPKGQSHLTRANCYRKVRE